MLIVGFLYLYIKRDRKALKNKMETKQINIYDFDELSDEIKEKVLNKFREGNDYIFLEENLNEGLNALLESKDIKVLRDCNLRYDFGYSQGSGLSFVGDFEYKGIGFNIGLNSWGNHYQHSKTTNINRIDDDYEDDDDHDITAEIKIIKDREADEVLKEFEDIYFEICNILEKQGYEHIEYEDSDENLSDNIRANEYKFRENGEIEF